MQPEGQLIAQIFYYLFLAISMAFVARNCGYSFILWLIAAVCINPWGAAIMLAALPDRALDAERKNEHEDLERQLAVAGAGVRLPPQAPASTDLSLGDLQTRASGL